MTDDELIALYHEGKGKSSKNGGHLRALRRVADKAFHEGSSSTDEQWREAAPLWPDLANKSPYMEES